MNTVHDSDDVFGEGNQAKDKGVGDDAYLFCRVRNDIAGLGFGEVAKHHEGGRAVWIISKETDGTSRRMRSGVEALPENETV